MNKNQEPVTNKLDDPMFATVKTPLELVVGFKVAEETYDRLNFREQLIVDLLCAGWNQAQIGVLFEVSQPSISSSVRRIRAKLADGKLRFILEARQEFREGRG